MAAAERSRSPVGGSPVPACMFAPEPGSPGGGPRVAAAACPLRAAFDAEDGEALNGEPEIDLTSKVGPGAVGGGQRRAPSSPRRAPRCPLPGDRLALGVAPQARPEQGRPDKPGPAPLPAAPLTSGEPRGGGGGRLPPPGGVWVCGGVCGVCFTSQGFKPGRCFNVSPTFFLCAGSL